MPERSYALKGDRQGFDIKVTDDVTDCPDGYTEVRRNGQVAGVYLTTTLAHPTPSEKAK
jgi:hypothetical protein